MWNKIYSSWVVEARAADPSLVIRKNETIGNLEFMVYNDISEFISMPYE